MLHGTIISHCNATRTILLVRFCSTAPIAVSPRPLAASVRSGKRTVLYQLYQSYADGLAPLQSMAVSFADAFARPWFGLPQTQMQRGFAAVCQMFAEGRL